MTLDPSERAYVRSLFEAWKAENVKGGRALTKHPTFRIALARLTNEHGYSLTDVAMFLGVSRARVGQWVNKADIPAKRYAQMRIWSDDLNRFVTVSGHEEYHRRAQKVRNAERPSRIPYRRRVAVWVLRDLHVDLGRVPVLADLGDAFQRQKGYLQGFLRYRKHKTHVETFDKLWAQAGFTDRPKANLGRQGRRGLKVGRKGD